MRERAKREKTKTSEEKARVCQFFELREYKTLRVNSSNASKTMRVIFKNYVKKFVIFSQYCKKNASNRKKYIKCASFFLGEET